MFEIKILICVKILINVWPENTRTEWEGRIVHLSSLYIVAKLIHQTRDISLIYTLHEIQVHIHPPIFFFK